LNQTYLILGVGLVILGVLAASSGRRKPDASLSEGKKAKGSPMGTVGMFFVGLGIVLVVISL
jgi:hypothetical protein